MIIICTLCLGEDHDLEGKYNGYLFRKPTMDNPNRKAAIRYIIIGIAILITIGTDRFILYFPRQWKQYYVILKDYELRFFKDQKSANSVSGSFHSVSIPISSPIPFHCCNTLICFTGASSCTPSFNVR